MSCSDISEKNCNFAPVFDYEPKIKQKKMKKVLFVMVAVAALTMSSCCNKKCKETTCEKADTCCVAVDSCCKADTCVADTCATCEKADSCTKACK